MYLSGVNCSHLNLKKNNQFLGLENLKILEITFYLPPLKSNAFLFLSKLTPRELTIHNYYHYKNFESPLN